MPYKDIEDRRRVIRESMAAKRAAWRAKNPPNPPGRPRTLNPKPRAKRKPRPYTGPKPQTGKFIGVDGEGSGQGIDHRYWLLRVGDQVLHHNGDDLTIYDCLSWLADLGASQQFKGQILVGYYLDYDFSMMLRKMDPRRVKDLLRDSSLCRCAHLKMAHVPLNERQVGQCMVCDCEAFRGGGTVTISIPGGKGRRSRVRVNWVAKQFSVTWAEPATTRCLTISDASGFFASSFVSAIEKWEIGTPEIRLAIAAMKDKRSDFQHGFDQEVFDYNALECVLLAELMDKLRETCYDLGIYPQKWQGAGQAAQALLVKEHFPLRKHSDLPKPVEEFAERAYSAGWFELFRVGPIGTVHSIDVASAYPHAFASLPCLLQGHGQWVLTPWEERVTDVGMFPVEASLPDNQPTPIIGALFYRSVDKNICHPASTNGVYWANEISAAQAHYAAHAPQMTLTIGSGWQWVQTCEDHPGAFVEQYYQERLKLGKSAKGIVIKLMLNSLYGKAAQRVGTPPYSNSVIAGLITSTTRTRLIEAATLLGPENIVSFQTDGIFATAMSPDLDAVEKGTPPRLGQWEHELVTDLITIQSGVYAYTNDKGEIVAKSRGFSANPMIERLPEFAKQWSKRGWEGSVKVTQKDKFIGTRLAAHRNKAELAGTWQPDVREMGYASNGERRELGEHGRTRSLRFPPKLEPPIAVSNAYDDRAAELVMLEREYSRAVFERPDGPVNFMDRE